MRHNAMWHDVPANPLNFCRECGQDFSSLRNFDAHRTGSYEPNERHCLDAGDLREMGMTLDKNGRWYDPVRAAKVAASFAGSTKD